MGNFVNSPRFLLVNRFRDEVHLSNEVFENRTILLKGNTSGIPRSVQTRPQRQLLNMKHKYTKTVGLFWVCNDTAETLEGFG